jgi:hypothetical protein
MKKPPQVQIPQELFSRICMYFLLDRTEPEQVDAITTGLQDKLNRMQLRTEYTEQLRKRQ